MRHLVIGMGEVGSALHEVLLTSQTGKEVFGLDKTDDPQQPDITDIDFMHVCIPWSDWFIPTVTQYVDIFKPGLVIVHSTVPIGTCDPQGWIHSPIRGIHPELVEGIEHFKKHFGGRGAAIAASMWEGLHAHTTSITHSRAKDTEAGKLWELVQYGVQIRMEKAIHAFCEDNELDYTVVYQDFAKSYNAGFPKLGEPKYVRPILDHVPGDIGGHCVKPMSELLDHPAAKIVREGFE